MGLLQIFLFCSVTLFQAAVGVNTAQGRTNLGRSLQAAQLPSNLNRRDLKGCLRHDHQLHYLDSWSISPQLLYVTNFKPFSEYVDIGSTLWC